MNYDDVTNAWMKNIAGFSLPEAKKVIGESGMYIGEIIVTSPPRDKSDFYDDSYRVVRVEKIEEDKIDLLIAKPL